MDRFTVIYGIIVIGLIEFKESYANSDGKFMKIKVKHIEKHINDY